MSLLLFKAVPENLHGTPSSQLVIEHSHFLKNALWLDRKSELLLTLPLYSCFDIKRWDWNQAVY